jgi:hypothetical protein
VNESGPKPMDRSGSGPTRRWRSNGEPAGTVLEKRHSAKRRSGALCCNEHEGSLHITPPGAFDMKVDLSYDEIELTR